MPSSFQELIDGLHLLSSIINTTPPVVLILILAVLAVLIWAVWKRLFSSSHRDENSDGLLGSTTVNPRPFLSKGEATLLNLIRLAVQDIYLVFAKVPVSSLVMITEEDPERRRTILKTIQSTRVDVALIHPGTLRPALGIKFVEDEASSRQLDERDQLVGEILQAAGIEIIRVELHTAYTVAELVTLLGLGETE